MKIQLTQSFLSIGSHQQQVMETRECDFVECGLCASGEYYCTTEPADYLCAPEGYPCSRLAHVHVSNVEPCDPDPSPNPESETVKPCVAEPPVEEAREALSECLDCGAPSPCNVNHTTEETTP